MFIFSIPSEITTPVPNPAFVSELLESVIISEVYVSSARWGQELDYVLFIFVFLEPEHNGWLQWMLDKCLFNEWIDLLIEWWQAGEQHL